VAKRKNIVFTGERVIDNGKHGELFVSSLERYKFVASYIKEGDSVLDIASGSGYGTNYLSNFTNKVCGADVDQKSIDYCKDRYGKNSKIKFVKINQDELEKSFINKFDVVVSIETIEHSDKRVEFLRNLSRYMKRNGTLIISTPNNYLGIYPPENEFHKYEYQIEELVAILHGEFPDFRVLVFGQLPTGIMSSDKIVINPVRAALRKLRIFVYSIDNKLFHILSRLEHTEIYKKLGRLFRGFEIDQNLYPIDLSNSYNIPLGMILVLERR